MMLGPKISTVFKSRWNALFWAAGILATAYCTVPAADQAAKSEKARVAASKAEHRNPWAKDTTAAQ
ncbi:hypothetical protein JI59_11050 [Novosphingobium pentaromativorans US6-1]|uniref:Uncharacterized protein n=2 Tax=Sphingomonadaceae TaxID=41297 RepID=G6EBT5_9SPHN|nr:hypothetical protein JI59_11050 [Novosphingobium pentaromativorans US6-1]EHJ61218.1 hypothetical protein NSU_1806 [Novosphingobium pentaromativorans US6-1]GFM30344.1 hypothetical protein PY1_contig_09_76 [Novosphingobium sp. PY1]